jgi:hypothetical protein
MLIREVSFGDIPSVPRGIPASAHSLARPLGETGKIVFLELHGISIPPGSGCISWTLSADLIRKMAEEAGHAWPVDRDAAMPF